MPINYLVHVDNIMDSYTKTFRRMQESVKKGRSKGQCLFYRAECVSAPIYIYIKIAGACMI